MYTGPKMHSVPLCRCFPATSHLPSFPNTPSPKPPPNPEPQQAPWMQVPPLPSLQQSHVWLGSLLELDGDPFTVVNCCLAPPPTRPYCAICPV